MYMRVMPTLLIGAATSGLVGVDADLDSMAAMVTTYGLHAPVIVRDATLAEVRLRLAELVARTEAGAPVLLYLTGHGGVVTNRGHSFEVVRPGPRRLHYFRTVAGPGGGDEALFEVELSLWCARLAARSTNVVVVIDSCHASGLVRDEAADQAFVAGFEAWCDAHQDEVDGLGGEAHMDVVRLSAAGSHGVARAATGGSALTSALVAALAEPGAAQASWFGLFARIERHMAMAGAVQLPRLSGPVRRRIFNDDCVEGVRAGGVDDGAAQVRGLLGGGGVEIGAVGLRVTWGRVRDGVCEPLRGSAVVGDDEPLYVRVANVGYERRFVGVFWVSGDGEIVLLSRSEAMGVELDHRDVYVLGDRPFARAVRGEIPPRRPLKPGERRQERIVVVGAEQRQALWCAVTGEGRRAGEIVGVEVVHITIINSKERA